MSVLDTSQIEHDYRVLVDGCGLVDRSERGKLALTGSGTVEFLNGQVTNELLDLQPGDGRYAAFLTHKGKMLGDLRILACGEGPDANAPDVTGADSSLGPSELLLDTERVALQALFDMIRRFKVGYDVELHKRTLESGLLSLIGPGSRAVLTATLEGELDEPELSQDEHSHRQATLGGHPVRLIATDHGGVDVLFASEAHVPIQEVLTAAGAQPVDEQVAEIVRVERGRPRYGLDIDESTIPQEAALNERAVSFTKGCYVGQETVARLYYKGKPNRHLRGLRLSEPVPTGAEMRLGQRPVGLLGSTLTSPRLGPIALALVRREAEPGSNVSVGDHGAHATVVQLPFEIGAST